MELINCIEVSLSPVHERSSHRILSYGFCIFNRSKLQRSDGTPSASVYRLFEKFMTPPEEGITSTFRLPSTHAEGVSGLVFLKPRILKLE